VVVHRRSRQAAGGDALAELRTERGDYVVAWTTEHASEEEYDGVAVIYISHYIDEVMAVADRLTVLRDGAVVTSAALLLHDPQVCWSRSVVRSRRVSRSEPHQGQVVRRGSKKWSWPTARSAR